MVKKHIEIDLFIVDTLALLLVLTVFVFPDFWLRQVLGIIFFLFCPGYTLVAAVFPTKEGPGSVGRIGLSLGISVAIEVFIGLLLNFSPWGIRPDSILLSLSLFTLLFSTIAWYARRRVNAEARFNVSFRLGMFGILSTLTKSGKGFRVLVILLLCAVLGTIGALGYIMTRPLAIGAFAEFYILGAERQTIGYPRELKVGEENKVVAGIISHEPDETEYVLEVVVAGESQYRLSPISLRPGEKWEEGVGFTVSKPGDNQKIEFRLYSEGDKLLGTRYLWVNGKM